MTAARQIKGCSGLDLITLFGDQLDDSLRRQRTVDLHLLARQIDLDPGLRIFALNHVSDRADAMAAGHALNLEYVHIDNLFE